MKSPLQLERSNLIRLDIHRTKMMEPIDEDTLSVTVTSGVRQDSNRNWRVSLVVSFGGSNSEPTSPIAGSAEIEGFFEVHPEFPEEKIGTMVHINGASILYGSLREMFALLAGRTDYGSYFLPSVSFRETDVKKTPIAPKPEQADAKRREQRSTQEKKTKARKR